MPSELEAGAPAPDPRTRVPLSIERVLLAAAMAAIALITVANVATRYLTDISLAFTEEYSVALMVAVALIGSALAIACGRHIRVGVLADSLPPRGRRALEAVALLLAILCFALLAWFGGRMAYDEWDFEALTPGLGNPQWIYTATLPVLSLLVIARAAGRLIRVLRGEDG
jgi:TRAP-type C4-dicarboxylate transport system permease small subunit